MYLCLFLLGLGLQISQVITLLDSTPLVHALQVFGTYTTASDVKKDYHLPRSVMTNSDLTRLINSDEIQSLVRPQKAAPAKHGALKKNPLKNLGAMLKLNPYAKAALRREVVVSVRIALWHGCLSAGS